MRKIEIDALKNVIAALIGGMLLLSLNGCGTPPASDGGSVQSASFPGSSVACADSPLRVVMLVDLSSSMQNYGVTLPTVEDVAAVVEVVESCGGEVAIGPIKEDPTTPLARLRLDPRKMMQEPQRQDFANPFDYAKAIRPYREYKEQREKEVAAFLKAAEELLEAEGTATGSDVHSGLNRVALFLGEDGSSWETTPQKFGVLITDAVHNAGGASYRRPPSDVTYLVVSGRAGLGSLSRLQPTPLEFESSSAALRYIESKGVK